MKNRKTTALLSLIIILAIGVGVLGGVLLDRRVLVRFVPPDNIPAGAEPSFRLIAEAWNTIEQSYVDREELTAEQLTNGAIRGMVDSLGDIGHSRFMTPEQAEQSRNALRGELEGIGAELQERDGEVVIVAPFDGSPAERAGLQPGDVIVRVDGEEIGGLSLGEVVSRILGPAGTQVSLTLRDPESGQTRDVTITRARIALDNVRWWQLPETCLAHVRIASFSEGVAGDLRRSLDEIHRLELGGIILDLRNNPGGLVEQAVGTASQFLEAGNVLLVEDAQGQVRQVPVEPPARTTLPLVVLINEGSASSAEIVAGALQDTDRAPLVGTTTFGTGTVLREFRLSDGSALLLATEKWLTPGGQVIWHQGIEPDVWVELPDDVSPLRPQDGRGMSTEELRARGDTQLLHALDLLQVEVAPACPAARP